MTRIVVVCHSVTGTTERLAAAVCEGAADPGNVEIERCVISGDDIERGRFVNEALLERIDRADAVIFGCPTYMGGPSAQFKAFADASSDRWSARKWAGKLAAGFTVGTALNGDQLNTLMYFGIFAAQHGMLWIGMDAAAGDGTQLNRLGTQFGAAFQSDARLIEEIDLRTARHLGARVVREARLRSCKN